MSIIVIVVIIAVVLTMSVTTIHSLEKYKRRVAKDVCGYLSDLIDILNSVGLNKDLLDRYDTPEITPKIKIINGLIDRCDEKMTIFMELNKHIKFMSELKAEMLLHTYKLNIYHIRMSLNALTRAMSLYGAKSDKVYTLIKRYDRIIVLSSDGLSGVLVTLNKVLEDYR